MRLIHSFLLVIVFSLPAFSQGSIAGKVKDAKTGEALIGANVVIQGTTIGAATDVDGAFEIPSVKEGTYTLQVSYVTYKAHIISDVVVETAKRVTLDDIILKEDASELQEVVISVGRRTDTDFDLIRSIKDSKVIVVGVTAEQIGKSLDRDAAQVLKRVPGITIKDDQFIISRGLAERYNPVMLHNTYAPSVEADVRSFSFATIPSNQLDRILVYKSPAADLPGDFAGSVVKIFTKSIPEENGWSVDYSTQYRAGTTFQDFYHQERNPGFLSGYNTGYYDLPAGFPATLKNLQGTDLVNAGRSLKNLWGVQKSTAIPDQRLTVTYNAKFNAGSVKIGSINAFTYSNAYAIYNITRGDYTDTDLNFAYNDRQYNQQIRSGLLSNWAFKINSDHQIEFKNLYNVSSNDQYAERYGAENTISGGQVNGALNKIYRGIYSGQLMGKHDFFHKQTTVEWVAGYNNTYRDQPDYKRYQSLVFSGVPPQIVFNNTVTPTSLGRFYSKMNENSYSGGASIKQVLPIGKDVLRSPELKAGFFFEDKSRTFNARNMGYTQAPGYDPNTSHISELPMGQLMESQNISNTGLQLEEITYRKDSYKASNKLLAYYFMVSLPIGSKIKLDAGARVEDNRQSINSYNDFAVNPKVDTTFHVVRLLPSANFSYNFTSKMLVRAAYGRTLNRPEFRELAPFSFYDFNFNFIYYGNPALKTADVQNADLRWEFYPSNGEMITIGGFYKYFTDPIESYIDINSPGGGNKLVTFTNSKSATVYGIEIEAKKSLAGLTSSRFLNNLSVMINSSFLSSEAHVPDAPVYSVGRATSRPLQGQSPYIVNAGLYYNSEGSGWQVNLLYNTVGKTLYFVGTDFYHDVYVLPRNVVDLVFTKRLSEKFSLKGGVTDILNQPIRYYNSGTTGGELNQVIQSYKPGQVFSIGFTARF